MHRKNTKGTDALYPRRRNFRTLKRRGHTTISQLVFLQLWIMRLKVKGKRISIQLKSGNKLPKDLSLLCKGEPREVASVHPNSLFKTQYLIL